MLNRILKLQEALKKRNIQAILVFKPENRRYVSNFTGTTGYVIITEKKAIFATDFRYIEQAEFECKDFEIIKIDNDYTIFKLIDNLRISNIGVEEDFLTLDFEHELKQQLVNINLMFCSDAIKDLRMVKTQEEIDMVKKACEITDSAFYNILPFIRPGITEIEISNEIQYFMKKSGAEATPHTFIVVSGTRSSLPHGKASDKAVEMGDFITMDIGCMYKGYWSDMTRTVVLGKANKRQKDIYSIVSEAQYTAMDFIKKGYKGFRADYAAREVIKSAGFGDYFGHGLGHGVGLEIHEPPRLAQNAQGLVALAPGMLVTNEPGIYIPGFGGVRIEDMVMVTEEGNEILTKSNKELIEL